MIAAAISLLLYAAAFAQAAPGAHLTVFVGHQLGDGSRHVGPGITDSVKDIEDELRRSGLFTIATSSEGAMLRLEVVARHTSGPGQTIAGVRALGGTMGGGNVEGMQQPSVQMSSLTTTPAIRGRVLETKLRVAGHEETFWSGDDSDSWRYTAKQVVKDLTTWVNTHPDAVAEAARTPR